MSSIASLIVRIGAETGELQRALATVGERSRGLDSDLKKLGNTPIGTQAQKSMDSMRATMDQIAQAQQRVADKAKDAAAGLEVIGGASKLTDSQLKQVNRTLQDGLSAFKALGKEAPEQLQRVADSVSGATKPLDFFDKKIVAIGAAVGTFLGNAALQAGQALVQAGRDAFKYADTLDNLSAATGISVSGLQDLEAIGVTSGTTIETLSTAVEQLQKHLDDPAAIKALQQMGLSYDHIRSLAPEEQFLEIAKSIAAIPDPVDRANAGAALFGKTWATIAPAIKGNIEELVKGMTKLSDAQLEAIDKAGDRFDQFTTNTKKRLTGFLGDLLIAADEAKLRWSDILNPLGALPRLEAGGNRAAELARLKLTDKDLAGTTPTIGAPRGLTFGGNTTPDFSNWDPTSALKAKEAMEQARIAAEKFKAVQDQLFGRATIDHAEELVRALGSTENVSKLTADTTKKLHEELGQALAAYHALGRDVPTLLQAVFDKTAPLVIQARTIGNGMAGANLSGLPSLAGLSAEDIAKQQRLTAKQTIGNVGAAAAENIKLANGAPSPVPAAKFADNLFAGVPGAILGAIQGGGSKYEAAGSAIGMSIFGKDSSLTKTITGWTDKLPGVFGKALGSAIPVIGSLIGPGIAGLQKLFGKSEESAKVSPLRDVFFKAAGGLESLNPRVLSLTGNLKAVDDVFKAKTSDQYAAAIGRLNTILAEGQRKFDGVNAAAKTAGDKLSHITTITPDLQAALDGAFDPTNADNFRDAVDRINTAVDKQQEKFDLIRTTLSKYGLSATDAGKQFRQMALNETAAGLIADFNTLKDAGVDVNVEVHGMSDGLSKFAQDAKKAGVEVPEDMRNILQAAIDNGDLFDENGKKITDMKDLGLTFGTTMQTVMTKTIPEAMSRLTTVLEGLAKFLGIDLPKAAATGASGVQTEFDKNPPVLRPKIEWPDEPPPDYGGEWPPPQVEGSSTGSIVRPWGLQHFINGGIVAPDNRIVAVSDGELIMNVAQQKNVADALTSAPAINIYITGPVLAATEYVEQHLVEPIISGIQRYHRPAFGRLVASVTP